jgi:hypothetical protein
MEPIIYTLALVVIIAAGRYLKENDKHQNRKS